MNISQPSDASPLFVSALARGISVLRAFKEGKPQMSLQELASAAGLTKSAAQRFSHTLWTIGYLHKDPITRKFSLSPRALELGMEYAQSSPFISSGQTFLHALNRATGETCSLAEPAGNDVIYVARFAAHKEMLVQMPVGMRLPLYCTAAGRAILSHLDRAKAVELLSQCDRVAYTATTITAMDALIHELDHVRQHGYSRSNGEYYPGDITLSAAIVGVNGNPVGAINISVPSSRWTFDEAQKKLAPQLLEVAHALTSSCSVGYTRPFYEMEAVLAD